MWPLSATLTIASGTDVTISGRGGSYGNVGAEVALSGSESMRVIEVASGGALTLFSVALIRGFAGEMAAAIYSSGGSVTLVNVTMSEHTAMNGWDNWMVGCLIVLTSSPSHTLIRNCEIVHNRVEQTTSWGGITGGLILIDASSTTTTIENCRISSNNVSVTSGNQVYGGLINKQVGVLVLRNTTFDYNLISADTVVGGCVQQVEASDVEASDVIVQNNTITSATNNNGAKAEGAFMHMTSSGNLMVRRMAATHNQIRGFETVLGGVFFVQYTHELVIEDSAFISNAMGAIPSGATAVRGGVLWAQDQFLVRVDRSIFTAHAATSGGALYLLLSYPATIERSAFANNNVTAAGGAITVQSLYAPVAVTIIDTNFTSNRCLAGFEAALALGGASIWTAYPLSIWRSIFEGHALQSSLVSSGQTGADDWELSFIQTSFFSNGGTTAIVSSDPIVTAYFRDCTFDETGPSSVEGGVFGCANNSAAASAVYGRPCGTAALCEEAFNVPQDDEQESVLLTLVCMCDSGYSGDPSQLCSRLPTLTLSETSFSLFVEKGNGAVARSSLFIVNTGDAVVTWSLEENTGVQSYLATRWSATPNTGSLAPFAMSKIELILTPAGLHHGLYALGLVMVSNDWSQPRRGVNLTLSVDTVADAATSVVAFVSDSSTMFVGGSISVNVTSRDLDGLRVRNPTSDNDGLVVALSHNASIPEWSYSVDCDLGYSFDKNMYLATCSLPFDGTAVRPRAGDHTLMATMHGAHLSMSPLRVTVECPITDDGATNTTKLRSSVCTKCEPGFYGDAASGNGTEVRRLFRGRGRGMKVRSLLICYTNLPPPVLCVPKGDVRCRCQRAV